jgi:uncharacterized protein YjbJ (UPF0337 family)
MNWNIVKGNWKQFRGVIKGQWGRLTNDPLDETAGKRDELEGRIQETYGEAQEGVKKAANGFSEQGKK